MSKKPKMIFNELNQLANQLMSGHHEASENNLLRLLKYIENEDLLKTYIQSLTSKVYTKSELFDRGPYQPYNIPVDFNESVAFTYQLLSKYFEYDELDYLNFAHGYSTSRSIIEQQVDFHAAVVAPFLENLSNFVESKIEIGDAPMNFVGVQQVNIAKDNATISILDQSLQVGELKSTFNSAIEEIGSREHPEKELILDLLNTIQQQLLQSDVKPSLIQLTKEKLKDFVLLFQTSEKVQLLIAMLDSLT